MFLPNFLFYENWFAGERRSRQCHGWTALCMTRDCLQCRIQLDTSGTRSTHLMGHQAGTLRGTGRGKMQDFSWLSFPQECAQYLTEALCWCTNPSTFLPQLQTPWDSDLRICNVCCLSYCCGSAQANSFPVGERLVGACSHCTAALCFTAVYPGNPGAFTTTHRAVRLLDRKNPAQMDAATVAEVSWCVTYFLVFFFG